MNSHIIATTSELPPGSRKIVHVAGRSIGVFNIHGTYYAVRNQCPHMGAPLCQGSLDGTLAPSAPGHYHWHRDGEILRCPWHGWEFDITTGHSISNPHTTRVKTYDVTIDAYDVTVEDGHVVLHV